MPVEIRGQSDKGLEAIASVLESYEKDHHAAKISLYRHSPYSVRVRVIDPDFSVMSRGERNDLVWDYLDRLSEDEQADINMLVLITPEEVEKSIGNMEFEDPVSSSWAEA